MFATSDRFAGRDQKSDFCARVRHPSLSLAPLSLPFQEAIVQVTWNMRGGIFDGSGYVEFRTPVSCLLSLCSHPCLLEGHRHETGQQHEIERWGDIIVRGQSDRCRCPKYPGNSRYKGEVGFPKSQLDTRATVRHFRRNTQL